MPGPGELAAEDLFLKPVRPPKPIPIPENLDISVSQNFGVYLSGDGVFRYTILSNYNYIITQQNYIVYVNDITFLYFCMH